MRSQDFGLFVNCVARGRGVIVSHDSEMEGVTEGIRFSVCLRLIPETSPLELPGGQFPILCPRLFFCCRASMAQPDYIRRANKRKGKLPVVDYEELQPPKKKKKKRVRPMAFKKRGEESYAEQASRTDLTKWAETAAKKEATTSLINVTATRHHISMASGLDEVYHLLKLPRELRDRIYEYAYTNEDLTALDIGSAVCVIIPAEDLAPQHSAAEHIDGEKLVCSLPSKSILPRY